MVELGRTVRLCLDDRPAGRRGTAAGPVHNGFSGWPAMRGLGRFYEIHVTCRGPVDPATGYSVDIKDIDRGVRERVLPYLSKLVRSRGEIPLGAMMRRIWALLQRELRREVAAVRFDLTPYARLETRSDDMAHVLIRQQFEFAAAHRLHVPGLGARENRRVFGKCDNPNGHGHNYRLEVVVRGPIDRRGRIMALADLDALVDRHVLQKLDHKHLNLDVPAFARLNPSVENIARVIFTMLKVPLRRTGAGLEGVSVWETAKTVCTYRAEDDAGRANKPGTAKTPTRGTRPAHRTRRGAAEADR
jgi:6-pyruvoyltetrahydropterin/6-carboxytetrahydropterin synthase